VETLLVECPLAIVRTDERHRVRSCNPAFERMFLYTAAEIAGRGLEQVIGESRTQGRRKDGTTIYLESHVVPEISHGACLGYFYMLQDVTDRRNAEAALAAAGQEANAARESERSRIARDLHDDIAQQLALLQIGLDELKNSVPKPTVDALRQIDALSKQTAQIVRSLRAFVYDLHPPERTLTRLDHTLHEMCATVGKRLHLVVDFSSRDVPDVVPADIAECLFRVLQEGLTNVARHSGTRRVGIRLWVLEQSICLTIRDFGHGFVTARHSPGIGLATMRERVSAVHGMIWIASKPTVKEGTSIAVRIPLVAEPRGGDVRRGDAAVSRATGSARASPTR
jgi:signal transduction histidine kinase